MSVCRSQARACLLMATHYSFVRGAPAAAAHMNGPDAMEVDAAQPASQPQQPGTQTPQQPCQVEVIIDAGGITTVGHAMHSTNTGANIATVLAANSGRPGGACRAGDGTIQRSTIHGGHSTQEEDVIANWLLASGSGWCAACPRSPFGCKHFHGCVAVATGRSASGSLPRSRSLGASLISAA